MRVAAIIAEYNPFHSGHRYHIEKTREAGATHIVAVMSGSVVQRGDVAVMSPHDRAEEAVKGGADLVLELPPQYSLGAARDFARAGVSVIRRLGCADLISFGAECGDVGELSSALADLKDNELKIKSLMSCGRTYPQAAAEVCEPSTAGIISSPNNTLALEYLRALGGCEPPVPLAVKRTVPHDSSERSDGFASASEIRRMLRTGEDAGVFLGYDAGKTPLSFIENGERAILFRLSAMTREDFGRVPYCRELAGRLYDASRRAESLDALFMAAKSRNFTLSRVRRAVLLAALGVCAADMAEPPFVRVLAMNARGAEVLRLCKTTSSIDVGSSLAALSALSPAHRRSAELIELASRLRGLCCGGVTGRSEYRETVRRG